MSAPTGGHVLIVTHDLDGPTYRIECHEPEGADCRLNCPEGCETWHIERDKRGPYHVTDSGVRHDLTPYAHGCAAVEYFDADPLPEFVFSVRPHILGRTYVAPRWRGEGVEWSITTPAPTSTLPEGVEVRRCPDGELWLRREHVLDLRGDGRRWICLSARRIPVTDETAAGWAPVTVTLAEVAE